MGQIAKYMLLKLSKRLCGLWSIIPLKNGEVMNAHYDWDTEHQKKYTN